MKGAAVILAAGSSSRFGYPKALLKWRDETLLQRACRIAKESNHDFTLVIAAPGGPISQSNLPEECRLLENPGHRDGMGTSLALAAKQTLTTGVDFLTILFPDQPAITAENLLTLRQAISPPETTITISRSSRHTGPPAIFTRKHFPALTRLVGDEGGKSIVKAHPAETRHIAIPEAHWDIDTPEIWERFSFENSSGR